MIWSGVTDKASTEDLGPGSFKEQTTRLKAFQPSLCLCLSLSPPLSGSRNQHHGSEPSSPHFAYVCISISLCLALAALCTLRMPSSGNKHHGSKPTNPHSAYASVSLPLCLAQGTNTTAFAYVCISLSLCLALAALCTLQMRTFTSQSHLPMLR